MYTNAASRAVTITDGGTSADKLNLHPNPVNILRPYIYLFPVFKLELEDGGERSFPTNLFYFFVPSASLLFCYFEMRSDG